MVASWEIQQQQSVLCAILHVETTTIAWSFGLRNLIIPGQVVGLTGMPFDMARNEGVKACLAHGFQYLFFLDSDVIPPRDAVLRLLAHKLPIVSGLYFRRSPPVGIPVMQKPPGHWVTQFPENALLDVDTVGSGCLLIHRSVLEKMQQQPLKPYHPWFHWGVDRRGLDPDDQCMSEDFNWCLHAKKLGYRVLVDTSIQCKHVGYSESKYAYFGPLETSPVT